MAALKERLKAEGPRRMADNKAASDRGAKGEKEPRKARPHGFARHRLPPPCGLNMPWTPARSVVPGWLANGPSGSGK